MVRRGGGRAQRLRGLAVVAAAVLCCCLARGSHAAGLRASMPKVARRLQRSLESIASSGLLASFSEQDAYASARVRDRLAQITQGADTVAVEWLDMPEISAGVSNKASELLAPLFSQMTEMARDFDTLVKNSRGREQQPGGSAAQAGKCGRWPDEAGWLTEGASFAYPEGAQRVDRRDTAEFCKLFPEIQNYFASMQGLPAVHLAEYVTPKGEYMVYNLRDKEPVNLPASLDARTQPWYVEASHLPNDFIVVISTPRSLKLRMGDKEAVQLMEAVFNATLSLLSDDDNFQVIVAGYSVPCFSSRYLVPATRANQVKAIKFLREHISLHMPMGESTVSAASRLAWKMLADSMNDGYTSNCSRTVVYMTDGLVDAVEAREAVRAVDELQAAGPAAQVFAISVGEGGCSLCDSLICRNQGVHLNVPKMEDKSFLRSTVGSIVATHAAFLGRDRVQVSQPTFDAASGDYEMLLSMPIRYEGEGGALELHGVMALSVDVNYVIRELGALNTTDSPHYYSALFFTNHRPGLLFHHPLIQQMQNTRTYAPMTLRRAEGHVATAGNALGLPSPFDLMEAEDAVPGCSLVVLDRRMLFRVRGSSAAVYENLFSGISRMRNVSMCWSPVEGTPFGAVVVIDSVSDSKLAAFAASGMFPRKIRAVSTTFPITTAVPASVRDVYHRLDLWDPVAAAGGGAGGAASGVYLDYFAMQLAPRAFKSVAKLNAVAESEAQAKAISSLIGAGPGGTRQLIAGAEEGGGAALAAALPGDGLNTMALRDVQIARLVGALWNTSVWESEIPVVRDFQWAKGVKNAAVGMESGVWYSWPARAIPGAGSDVQDQPWYARAVDAPGKLVITRESSLLPASPCLSVSLSPSPFPYLCLPPFRPPSLPSTHFLSLSDIARATHRPLAAARPASMRGGRASEWRRSANGSKGAAGSRAAAPTHTHTQRERERERERERRAAAPTHRERDRESRAATPTRTHTHTHTHTSVYGRRVSMPRRVRRR